jgi:membrane associated rhomboid family serine protease
VPAFVFLGIWAVMQLANGYFSLGAGAGTDSGVAWFAHVGGFAYGAIVGVFVRATSALRRRRR